MEEIEEFDEEGSGDENDEDYKKVRGSRTSSKSLPKRKIIQ